MINAIKHGALTIHDHRNDAFDALTYLHSAVQTAVENHLYVVVFIVLPILSAGCFKMNTVLAHSLQVSELASLAITIVLSLGILGYIYPRQQQQHTQDTQLEQLVARGCCTLL